MDWFYDNFQRKNKENKKGFFEKEVKQNQQEREQTKKVNYYIKEKELVIRFKKQEQIIKQQREQKTFLYQKRIENYSQQDALFQQCEQKNQYYYDLLLKIFKKKDLKQILSYLKSLGIPVSRIQGERYQKLIQTIYELVQSIIHCLQSAINLLYIRNSDLLNKDLIYEFINNLKNIVTKLLQKTNNIKIENFQEKIIQSYKNICDIILDCYLKKNDKNLAIAYWVFFDSQYFDLMLKKTFQTKQIKEILEQLQGHLRLSQSQEKQNQILISKIYFGNQQIFIQMIQNKENKNLLYEILLNNINSFVECSLSNQFYQLFRLNVTIFILDYLYQQNQQQQLQQALEVLIDYSSMFFRWDQNNSQNIFHFDQDLKIYHVIIKNFCQEIFLRNLLQLIQNKEYQLFNFSEIIVGLFQEFFNNNQDFDIQLVFLKYSKQFIQELIKSSYQILEIQQQFSFKSFFQLFFIIHWFEMQQLLLDNKNLVEVIQTNEKYFVYLSLQYKEHLSLIKDSFFRQNNFFRYFYKHLLSLINFINTFFNIDSIIPGWRSKEIDTFSYDFVQHNRQFFNIKYRVQKAFVKDYQYEFIAPGQIHKNELFNDGLEYFTKIIQNNTDLKITLPQICFINEFNQYEEGIDQGGLFKEFLCSFIIEFLQREKELLETNAITQEIYISSKTVLNYENKIKLQIFGILIGLALKYSVTFQQPVNQLLIRKLFKWQNYIKELKFLDEQIYDHLLGLLSKEKIEELGLTFSIFEPAHQKDENLIPQGNKITVTQENLIMYIYYYANYRLNVQQEIHFECIQTGFGRVISQERLFLFNEEEISKMLNGEKSTINWKDFIENIKFFQISEHLQFFIEKFINDSKEEQVLLLLEFITNLRRPPAFGFSQINPSILIKGEENSENLPQSQTCQNILLVPEYESYEKLKKKFDKALLFTKGHYIN